ncbi:MAG: hypothetical protein IJI84_03915 [Clostridia bacterium]|nr:hypothetical protein [Clostridia bacterium]
MADKKAKFVDVQVETFLENAIYFNAKSLLIIVDFLGSCYLASKQPGAGVQYGKYKEVYYRLKPLSDERSIIFTFSGPTLLDIKKPNIKSITKEAKEILNDLISNICILRENILAKNENALKHEEKEQIKKMNIIIDIKGHSRGGVVANNIYRWFLKNFSKYEIKLKLKKLVIADPYAGPINRIIKKKNDNFDDINVPENIPESKIVVYTVAEKKFRDPAKSLKSNAIILTDSLHGATKYIAHYAFNLGFREGLFIYCDSNSELKKVHTAVNKYPTEKEQEFIDKWVKKHIEKVTRYNIISILQGAGKYKNFAYKKIASDGRRLMFYSSLSKEPLFRNYVQNFLEDNGHKSMWKKVEKILKEINI